MRLNRANGKTLIRHTTIRPAELLSPWEILMLPVKEYSPECLAYLQAFAAAGYDGAVCFETKCADLKDLRPALELLRSTIGRKA